MPRAYVRKTDRGSYSKEKLLEAVQAVKRGHLSGYTASKHYGIPRATIINRVYERKGMKSNSLGRATVLSQDMEEKLVKNLHILEKYGFGLTRKELMGTVGQYVAANVVNHPFKNGVPGEDWFLAFKKRNNLSVKKPQPVEYARKTACRPNVIYPYFDLLKETIDELHLHDKPSHMWNVDETSFSKDPSKAKVVGLKGFTSTRTIATPGKDNTTVLLGCSAIGEKTPPLIIFKGKNVWDEWTTEEGYPGTAYAATPNGWMETAVFEAWFEKVFLPTVGQRRPILLIYDGHSTHVGINMIEKARAAQITILKIPPHTSHVLQPLDLAVNKSFKDKWDTALVKWQRLNIGKTLSKKEFAKILGQIWIAIDPNVCAAGFKKAGIYPLNKDVIPESKFNQLLLREWTEQTTSNVEKIPDSTPKLLQEQRINPDSLVKIILKKINAEAEKAKPIPKEKKIHILEDRVVTFEDLLLMNIKAGTSNKMKKKRVAPGAEVITHDDVYERCKQIELENIEKLKEKQEKKKAKEDRKQKRKQTSKPRPKMLHTKKSYKNKSTKSRVLASPTSESEIEMEIRDQSEDNQDLFMREDYEEEGVDENNRLKNEKKTYKKTAMRDTEMKMNIGEKDTKQINKQKSKSKMTSNKKINKNKFTKSRVLASSTSESEIEMEIRDESDDEDYKKYCEDIIFNMQREEEENEVNESNKQKNMKKTCKKTAMRDIEMEMNIEDEIVERNSQNIEENDWLLVKFCTKQSIKYYVGVILRLKNDGVPVVRYVRKTVTKFEDQTVFTYPTLEDISEVEHLEDIVTKLPKPIMGRRGQIIFKMSFKKFNVQ